MYVSISHLDQAPEGVCWKEEVRAGSSRLLSDRQVPTLQVYLPAWRRDADSESTQNELVEGGTLV
jgi:hypothetical protein